LLTLIKNKQYKSANVFHYLTKSSRKETRLVSVFHRVPSTN